MTFIISSKIVSALRTCLKFVEVNNSEYVTHILINFNNNQNNKTKMSSASNKRPAQDSGASGDKRQRLSGYDSGFFESEESEPSPEISAGETKETDSDRRRREQEERKQKKTEEAAERNRQRYAKIAKSKTKLCIANIGGKRVEKNGIIEFEGGETFGPYLSRSRAEEATGISLSAINHNIHRKRQSRGEKGIFKNKQVMFINAPVDTSDRVHCGHCDQHFSHRDGMIKHVRAKHPGVLPPAQEFIRMPEEYKTFMTPITQKKYAFLVTKVKDNIEHDIEKIKMKKLMALVEGEEEPWPSHSIKGAAKKYHFTEEQILDSIDNKESLTIVKGMHQLQLGLGRTTNKQLAGRTVTFSWKYKVTEEDKIKLEKMNNRETYHMIARQYCEHMNAGGMFAKKNVIDDNGGLIKHGFVFEIHGGLFNLSLDRIEDEYTVNGQTFHKIHFTNLENALENINVVAFMANVPYKASTATIQEKYDIYKNKSVEQRQKEFKKVLVKSRECKLNGKKTPLYQHASTIWKKDDECKGAFPDTPTKRGFRAYWQHMLVLLEKQEGLCAVAKIPMSLESGPWLMSCDAIDPKKGHVPGNLRLVCLYNNTPNFSKLNKDLTDTRPTSLNTVLHNEYWRIV
jgi:hypothetical protein